MQGISAHELELEEARDAVARVEREYDLLEEQVGQRRGQRKLCIGCNPVCPPL